VKVRCVSESEVSVRVRCVSEIEVGGGGEGESRSPGRSVSSTLDPVSMSPCTSQGTVQV